MAKKQPLGSFFYKLLCVIIILDSTSLGSTLYAQNNDLTLQPKQKKAQVIKGTKSTNSSKSDSTHIHGELVDSKYNQPIPFENIMLYVDTVQTVGGITDIEGKFTIGPFIKLPGQKIELKCIAEGYRDTTVVLTSVQHFVSIKLKMDPTKSHVDIIICHPPNRAFSTPDQATFRRNDTPYLPPR